MAQLQPGKGPPQAPSRSFVPWSADRLVILWIDPRRVFVDWEIDVRWVNALARGLPPRAQLVLRLRVPGGQDPGCCAEAAVHAARGNYYFDLEPVGARLVAELGLRVPGGAFHLLYSSSPTTLPPDRESDLYEDAPACVCGGADSLWPPRRTQSLTVRDSGATGSARPPDGELKDPGFPSWHGGEPGVGVELSSLEVAHQENPAAGAGTLPPALSTWPSAARGETAGGDLPGDGSLAGDRSGDSPPSWASSLLRPDSPAPTSPRRRILPPPAPGRGEGV